MYYADGRVLVFAKAPYPGQVKTRLAEKYGKRGAAQLYRVLLHDTLGQARGLAPLQLWCAPDMRHRVLRRNAEEFAATLHLQTGKDLGERMYHAFHQALRNAPWAVLIGGDCVSLQRADLNIACSALRKGREAVLGPAEDGGYVLLGLRRVDKRLFRGVEWGSPKVLDSTRRRLKNLGYAWDELPMRWDVDYPRDLRRWRLNRGLNRWCSGGI